MLQPPTHGRPPRPVRLPGAWTLWLCAAVLCGPPACKPAPTTAHTEAPAAPATAHTAAPPGTAGAPAAALPDPATPEAAPVPSRYETRSILSMATRISLALPAGPAVDEQTAAVREIFTDIDARMSEWKATSALSKVNARAGGPAVEVPEDLLALIERGLELGRRTDGAFDITWAALWGLWDFKAEDPRPPPPAEATARAALVDRKQVQVDRAARTVRLLRPGMKMGLGGIAKGAALDRSAAELRRRGLGSFMLSAGGQVMVAGGKSGRPWRVGIRDPRGEPTDFFAVLQVQDGSVSTSGDYERFFIRDGRRYHHILNPRTGLPAEGLRSATVLSRSATDADALSTALMVLGPSKAMALVEADPALEAVLVDGQAKVHVSSGLRGRLQMVHPPSP